MPFRDMRFTGAASQAMVESDQRLLGLLLLACFGVFGFVGCIGRSLPLQFATLGVGGYTLVFVCRFEGGCLIDMVVM